MMFGILRFARYIRRVQENHKRALMERTFLDLPIELQKDIGWPADNASRKAARLQREINARPILSPLLAHVADRKKMNLSAVTNQSFCGLIATWATGGSQQGQGMPSNNKHKRSIVFFLVPDFSMIAFAMAVEPLRLANRMLGYQCYTWRLASHDGSPVTASNGVEISATTSLADERRNLSGESRPTMVFVCSGINVEDYNNKSALAWLREEHNRGVAVGGLCTGAYVLAKAGLLSGRRCAIHWENLPGFAEAFPKANVFADLYEIDGTIHTCAGGTAALDMMLSLIGDDHDDTLVNRICEMALTDRVRNAHDRQRLPLRARLGVQNAKVLSIIELMEAHLAEPLSLIEIADSAGLSRRQIERLFRQEMGRSPARYYLEIRLDRARHLLIQSPMPVVEVAVACGFVSASHFSKCYRELYDRSPQQERADRKQYQTAA